MTQVSFPIPSLVEAHIVTKPGEPDSSLLTSELMCGVIFHQKEGRAGGEKALGKGLERKAVRLGQVPCMPWPAPRDGGRELQAWQMVLLNTASPFTLELRWILSSLGKLVAKIAFIYECVRALQ